MPLDFVDKRPQFQADTTQLSPEQEMQFRLWAQNNNLKDVDHPDSHYDYRGFWLDTQGKPHPPGLEQHFPDTFKQHGHPTFSQESGYSKGAYDGGMWLDDNFQAQPPMAVSHFQLGKRGR